MKANNIGVEVKVDLGVTDEMAERALRVLEWYCRDLGKVVVPMINKDGSTSLYLRQNTGPTVCPCCGQSTFTPRVGSKSGNENCRFNHDGHCAAQKNDPECDYDPDTWRCSMSRC